MENSNNILIHIGFHKTGTTWLQNELFIDNNKPFITLSREAKGVSTLARLFFKNEIGHLLNSFNTNTQQIQKEFEQIVNEKPIQSDQLYVMSHERLSGNPHAGGFDASLIMNRLYENFPSAKIFIVIREQKSWLLSNYLQYLKIGGTQTLKKYLQTGYDGKRPGFSPEHIKYHFLIEGYQKKFGASNVLVLPYELLKKDSFAFINQLEGLIQKSISVNEVIISTKHNVSTNYYSEYKFRKLNLFYQSSSVNDFSSWVKPWTIPIAKQFKKRINGFVSQNQNNKVKQTLQHEIAEWAKGQYEESNRLTEKLTNLPLADWGYALPKN